MLILRFRRIKPHRTGLKEVTVEMNQIIKSKRFQFSLTRNSIGTNVYENQLKPMWVKQEDYKLGIS